MQYLFYAVLFNSKRADSFKKKKKKTRYAIWEKKNAKQIICMWNFNECLKTL